MRKDQTGAGSRVNSGEPGSDCYYVAAGKYILVRFKEVCDVTFGFRKLCVHKNE